MGRRRPRSQPGRCRALRTAWPAFLALALVAGTAACGDRTGVWPRYRLERAFYHAQKQLARFDLEAQSGQTADVAALRSALERVVALYDSVATGPAATDSLVLQIGAEARLRLADLRRADTLWTEATELYESVASDTLVMPHYRNLARMGLARTYERSGRFALACRIYDELAASFYPPLAEGGVNREVLALPRRKVALARLHFQDSVRAWSSQARDYYDGLAQAYPSTELGAAALGELGMMYAEAGEWRRVVATLNRVTDTAGTVLPAYWIDIGEITAAQLGDTAGAIAIFVQVAEAFPESSHRAEADLKRAHLLLGRREYSAARAVLSALKRQFEDRPAVIIPAQLMFASALAGEGNWDRARNEYQYLITNFPRSLQSVEAALVLARHFAEAGETARMGEWYHRADELSIELARSDRYPVQVVRAAMDLRVGVAVEQKRWDDAAARLGELAQVFKDGSVVGAGALYRLGWLHLRERRDTAAAGQAWRRFLTALPDHPQAEALRKEMNKWPITHNQDSTS